METFVNTVLAGFFSLVGICILIMTLVGLFKVTVRLCTDETQPKKHKIKLKNLSNVHLERADANSITLSCAEAFQDRRLSFKISAFKSGIDFKLTNYNQAEMQITFTPEQFCKKIVMDSVLLELEDMGIVTREVDRYVIRLSSKESAYARVRDINPEILQLFNGYLPIAWEKETYLGNFTLDDLKGLMLLQGNN